MAGRLEEAGGAPDVRVGVAKDWDVRVLIKGSWALLAPALMGAGPGIFPVGWKDLSSSHVNRYVREENDSKGLVVTSPALSLKEGFLVCGLLASRKLLCLLCCEGRKVEVQSGTR